jgi:hypothetical protein
MRYEPSNVSSKFGAPMGRHSTTTRELERDGALAPDGGIPRKLYLQRVRLDSGGYDSGGAYWGHGAPLYVATDHEDVTVFVRGAGREAAKDAVRALLRVDVAFRR